METAKAVCVVALVTAARPGLRKQQGSLVFLCCLTWDFFKAHPLMSPSFVTPQLQPRGCFQPGLLLGEESCVPSCCPCPQPGTACWWQHLPAVGAALDVQDEVSLPRDRVGSGGEPGTSPVVAGHRVVARGEVTATSSSRGNPGGYREGCSG